MYLHMDFLTSIWSPGSQSRSGSHLLELRNKLSEGTRRGVLDRFAEFIPLDVLDELVTEDTIKAVLLESGFRDDALIRWAVTEAKKTFAILARIGWMSAVAHFQQDGFTDEDLPVTIEGEPGPESFGSCPPPKQQAKHWDLLFNRCKWTIVDIKDFERRQWTFLAPVFSGDKFEYLLPADCPLPFLARGVVHNGNFSNVYEIWVPRAHFPAIVSLLNSMPPVPFTHLS